MARPRRPTGGLGRLSALARGEAHTSAPRNPVASDAALNSRGLPQVCSGAKGRPRSWRPSRARRGQPVASCRPRSGHLAASWRCRAKVACRGRDTLRGLHGETWHPICGPAPVLMAHRCHARASQRAQSSLGGTSLNQARHLASVSLAWPTNCSRSPALACCSSAPPARLAQAGRNRTSTKRAARPLRRRAGHFKCCHLSWRLIVFG